MKTRTLKAILSCLLFLTNPVKVNAECASKLKLSGMLRIDLCNPKSEQCVLGSTALYKYAEKIPDSRGEVTVTLHTSPWHFYGKDMRILRVDDVVALIKPLVKRNTKRIVLYSSWSGVKPDAKTKSLAEKLSEALGGIAVTGFDGFLWLSSDGKAHATHQAFTSVENGMYFIRPKEDVMEAFTVGWPAEAEDYLMKQHDAGGLLKVGAAWEMFMLCQDHALRVFETAAKLSNPIAAYDAAVIRLDRNTELDTTVALELLRQAAKSGDKKSADLLAKVTKEARL